MIEALLTGDPADRLPSLGRVFSSADAADQLEAALPDLLRAGDESLLEALAEGLARFAHEVAARRMLETLARRGGRVRAAALTVLRGEAAASLAAASRPVPSPLDPSPLDRPTPIPIAASTPSPASSSPAADSSRAGRAWNAAFEELLAAPTVARLAEAALALMELSDQRPAAASREALQALAGRLAMASIDHEGELQAGLARLAKGLKALA